MMRPLTDLEGTCAVTLSGMDLVILILALELDNGRTDCLGHRPARLRLHRRLESLFSEPDAPVEAANDE